jgi:hypothetical protein
MLARADPTWRPNTSTSTSTSEETQAQESPAGGGGGGGAGAGGGAGKSVLEGTGGLGHGGANADGGMHTAGGAEGGPRGAWLRLCREGGAASELAALLLSLEAKVRGLRRAEG